MNTANSTPEPEERTTLFHHRHHRRQVGKSLSHLYPAVVLLLGVAPVLTGQEPFTLLLGVEIVVGALYIGLMLRELRHLRHKPFHSERVAWLELAAASILFLEGYHIWHRHHEAELAGAPHRLHLLPWVYGTVACIYVVLAFRMHQLVGRTYLHLHADGFAVRTGRYGKEHKLRWADIATVAPDGPTGVLVRRTDGQKHRIAFNNLHDGAAHRDKLLARLQQAVNK